MEKLIQKVMENPDIKLILYGVIGIVILYLVLKIFKLPLKILANGILGVVLLYIVNLIGAGYGISVGINIVTAIIAGTLGIPGVIALVLFQFFM